MPTYSLDLQFLDPKKEGFPGAPVVQVYVKTHSRDAKGTIYISRYSRESLTIREMPLSKTWR